MHILFWIFITLYVFDYFIDLYGLRCSIVYSLFEVSIFVAEFYVNLLFLLPLILEKRGKWLYSFFVLLLLSLSCSAYFIAGLNQELLALSYSRAITSFLLNHSLFILISYLAWYFNRFQTEKQKRLQLENEKLQSELRLLKSQISPHFLFNALNNIYALTLIKSENAPKMLSTLSDILRYFLYEGDKKTVFLEAEIEIIEKYIQIQHYRQIPGMNNIQLSVKGDASLLKVPPLIFMTLIENAFKHGDVVETKNGFVNIGFSIDAKKISFSVHNSFVPKETTTGIGLKNMKSQLDIVLGDNYQLNISGDKTIFKADLIIYGS